MYRRAQLQRTSCMLLLFYEPMYLAVYLHEPVYLGRALEVYTLYSALPRGRHRPLYVLSYGAALPVYIYCAVSTRSVARALSQGI